jgi:hypothetical protein
MKIIYDLGCIVYFIAAAFAVGTPIAYTFMMIAMLFYLTSEIEDLKNGKL